MARRFFLCLMAFFIYSSLAICFFVLNRKTAGMFEPSADPISFLWFLNWWPFAMAHHLHHIIHSHYVWEPIGFNMMWATSIPTLSLLLWPVTHFCGVICTWNVIELFSPVLAAMSFYALLRTLRFNWSASCIGGYFFGFSSYELVQLLAHPNLHVIFLLPLMLIVCIYRIQKNIRRPVFIVSFALLGILQFGISVEILLSFAFFWVIALVVFWKTNRASYDFSGLMVDACYAVLLALIVLSPLLFHMMHSANQIQQMMNDNKVFSTDLLNFIIPTAVTAVGHSIFSPIASHFMATVFEAGAYCGIPLLCVIFLSFIESKENKNVCALLFLFGVIFLFSLGPLLHVAGHIEAFSFHGHLFGFYLPWEVLQKMPLFRNLLPVRFVLYGTMVAAIFVALYLQRSKHKKMFVQVMRYGLVLLAAVMIMPNTTLYQWEVLKTEPAFNQTVIQTVYGNNPNLIVLPYGIRGDSMLWQLESGMAFRMAGGYVGKTPLYFWHFWAVYFLRQDYPVQGHQAFFVRAMNNFCKVNRVDGVVIGPGTDAVLSKALLALPWKRYSIQGVIFLKVPQSLATT
jgi:hypothetical protein